MKAMPRKLLIHTVTLTKETASDFWEDEKEVTEARELSYVRIEPSDRIIRDKNGAEVQLAAILFYDCKNSRPKGVEFAVDDVIVFNGQKHRVQSKEPLYDEKRLHHYELGLIKYA